MKALPALSSLPPARTWPRALLALSLSLLLGACAQLPPGPAAVPPLADETLPAPVAQALAQAKLPPAALGAVALPLGFQARPWQHQAGVAMQPGSAMKLVTSVVALDRLGGAHSGRTRLLASAPVEGGVLRGDLLLQGGADPEFGQAALWMLLRELRDLGLHRIEGDLLLDRQRWRPTRLDIGVPPFDERPESWWNVIPDALAFDLGLQTLALKSDAQTLSAQLKPSLPGLQVDASRMQLNDQPCSNWSAGWVTPLREAAADGGARLVLQGSFPRNCTRLESLQAAERDRVIGLAFRQAWQALGGQWAGQAREAGSPAPAEARVLAEHRARPWGELLRTLNKTSDNTLARMLFLELGVPAMAAQPQAETLALARQAVHDWYAAQGIAAPGLVVDNGSGLSRSERISALALAQTVAWAWNSRHAPDLLMSLPVAGVDGTLRTRLQGSAAAGQARLKTGSLRNVRALAGVAYDERGRPWALAAMVNADEGIAAAREVLDLLVERIARGDLGPR
jgi:D-alanyl-D-alanine carboxypeptidase/D-alanyl-D-alanine-endopeptidase (penicillin-binding protein 4)